MGRGGEKLMVQVQAQGGAKAGNMDEVQFRAGDSGGKGVHICAGVVREARKTQEAG